MKKLFTVFSLLAGLVAGAQNILLVDNSPSRPTGDHVYASIPDALAAATAGDIIHVRASGVSYGNITLSSANSGISIYGVGVNPDKETLVKTRVGQFIVNASNVTISGFQFESFQVYIGNNNAVSNVTFENCQFDVQVNVASSASTTSNVFFRNSVFYSLFVTSANYSNNTVVSNSIFSYSANTANGQVYAYNGTIINNCLFYGPNTSRYAFYGIDASIVNNCIFYGRSPLPSSGAASNSTYSNCYATLSASDNAFPTGSGMVLQNIVTSISGGVFQTPVVQQAAWDMDWDVTLDPASVELINAGNDGTDIGLTGGPIPFSKTATSLPYIKSILMPSLIRQGDDLNVTFEVKGN